MEWLELLKLVLAFGLTFVLSYYLTPMVRKAAVRFGIVDKPDGMLKKHEEPVAYLGGLAVFMALLASVSLAYQFDQTALGILLGTTIIIILGLIDDFGVLTPKVKLGGQLIAVWVLVKAGISVQIIWLPEPVNWVITVVWIMGVTNAFNLIDVMDGLAAGTALIACIFLAGISFMNGNFLIAAFTLSLAGSLLGFLPYNFKPAKIYLGDTGSLAIGFILAALTINEKYTVNNELIGVLAPAVILGIPLFETVFLMAVRTYKRIPMMQGSPDHFALRLRRKGFSVEMTVVTTYLIGVALGLAGITMVYGTTMIASVVFAMLAVFSLVFAIYLLTGDKQVSGEKK